jgi:DNA modification methylase
MIACNAHEAGDNWQMYLGDCCEVVAQLPDSSVDFSIYSPPFVSLFVYSDSERDMGNCVDTDEFFRHYEFLIREKFRVTRPGRLSAVHCSDIPLRKWKDGVIGLDDFPGAIIAAHKAAGWVYHGRITIWRCPVVEMTRTKALGLLYKQLKKDSSRSRPGLCDYLLIFRKDGDNERPITHEPEELPVEQWQEWASPVWMTVRQTHTLNGAMAREAEDERHICPLQLDVIERALVLWSNPGDVVLSPFAGIGSEGVQSLKRRRRFVGVELKESYFRQAAKFLREAERDAATPDLLSLMASVA